MIVLRNIGAANEATDRAFAVQRDFGDTFEPLKPTMPKVMPSSIDRPVNPYLIFQSINPIDMQTSSLSQISTFAVFLPQYARGNGRFIKHEAYHSKRQRELILAKNQRYLERHRHKLKVFELYEQPSNQRIFRWPEEAPIAHHLLL